MRRNTKKSGVHDTNLHILNTCCFWKQAEPERMVTHVDIPERYSDTHPHAHTLKY